MFVFVLLMGIFTLIHANTKPATTTMSYRSPQPSTRQLLSPHLNMLNQKEKGRLINLISGSRRDTTRQYWKKNSSLLWSCHVSDIAAQHPKLKNKKHAHVLWVLSLLPNAAGHRGSKCSECKQISFHLGFRELIKASALAFIGFYCILQWPIRRLFHQDDRLGYCGAQNFDMFTDKSYLIYW